MNAIQTLAISAMPVILAITMHEAAHGYAARQLGDETAWQLGRVSLNPFRHIDWIGTVVLPAAILLISHGGMLFGWAKPVPVNFGRLRKPRSGMMWVAAAGPGANLLMALAWAALLKTAIGMPDFVYADAMKEMGRVGIEINAILMLLNLLPILPLDGGRILTSLLPAQAAFKYSKTEPFGMFVMIILLYQHWLDFVLLPPLRFFHSLIHSMFAL